MSKSTKALVWVIGLSAASITGVLFADGDSAAGDVGYYGLGQAATAEQIAGWDIDVRPDGAGLPPGRGSVLEGEALFEEKCAACHGFFGEGQGRWPVLAGGLDSLTDDRPEKTVGSYWPYATTLWDYIHRAMPFFNPQSLTDDEVYALAAYVLYLNDIVEDDFVATEANLAEIEMPNRDGFYRDPRPDMPQIACMENCKDLSEIKITWDSTELGVTPTEHFKDEAAAPPPAVAATAAGRGVYQRACAACHATGVAGAPQLGDKTAWLDRIGQGMDALVKHAVNGYHGKAGYMPPKGGNSQLNDDEVAAAVEFMVEQSRAKESPL